MMMQRLLLLVLVALSGNAFAQYDLLHEDALLFGWNSEPSNIVRANYTYNLNSNGINNGFLNASFRGDFLDADIKAELSDKLKSNTRLGLESDAALTYKHSGEKLGLVVGLRMRDHLNAKFSKELMEVFLFGNAPYAGQQLDFGGAQVNYFATQELYLGAETNGLSKGLVMGGGISIIRGVRFQQATLQRGDFFTEENGAYIDLDVDLEYRFSDDNSSGIGASGQFYLWKEMANGAQFDVQISDIGAISWQNLTTYKADTAYHFEGIEVDNILLLDDSLFDETNTDSLPAVLALSASSDGYTDMLPGNIQMHYTMPAGDKTNLSFGLRQLIAPGYIPRVSVGVGHRIKDSFAITGSLAYGGFGQLDIGLGFAIDTGGPFRLVARTNYLEALLSSKSGGQSAYVGIMVRL